MSWLGGLLGGTLGFALEDPRGDLGRSLANLSRLEHRGTRRHL